MSETPIRPVDMAALAAERERAHRSAVAAVQRLRREHPRWWVWHSSNLGFEGYYASPKGDDTPAHTIHAATAAALDEAIRQGDE